MELVAIALQTVEANQNVQFTDEVIAGNCAITHRDGSGIVRLKGVTDQCRARFKITLGGNIAIPTGGTVEAISIALALDGEPVPATTMIVTPAAVEQFFNVFGVFFVDVPRGCCLPASVQNVSTQAIEIQNAILVVERVA